jgi:dipeptidyl aminopeptidase/acylaminoacyl peptidase
MLNAKFKMNFIFSWELTMNRDTIKQVAWVGDQYVQGTIKGVILVFHGLGSTGMKQAPSTTELAWAAAGGLVVFPYYGPWSWMNRTARAFVDELVAAVYAAYKVVPAAPLITAGGSMGGYSSLLYTRYAARPVAACYANCPVCDLKFHFSERPDLPMSIRHAFRGYGEDLETLFAEHSPLSQVNRMPAIPYLILHGVKDKAVSKAAHSDPMVAAMRRRKLAVEYIEVPVMEHCGPMPLDILQREIAFVTDILKGKQAGGRKVGKSGSRKA